MNDDDIKKAEAAIGEHTDKDWAIKPQEFPTTLQDVAPELAEVLRDSKFEEKAKRYTQTDAAAADYQRRFKSRANNTSVALFITASATALLSIAHADPGQMLMGGDYIGLSTNYPMTTKTLSLVLGVVVFIASGVSIFNNQMLSQLKLYDNWMRNRARAESARLGYFRDVAEEVVERYSSNTHLLLECCCFFRRYQLQVQQAYYEGRSAKHSDSLRKTARWGAIGAVVVAAFSGAFGLAGAMNTDVMAFTALGTIGVALTAFSSRREAICQDERNAARYQATSDILSRIAEKYSNVQRSLAQGKNPSMLLKFIDAVNEQLTTEFKQWTEDAAENNKAFDELFSFKKTPEKREHIGVS